jgi:membrane associated rhomboid family serine protease
MFPLRDDNPTLRASIVTFAIIAANALMWIFVQGLGAEPTLSRSVCELGAIPGDLLGTLPTGTSIGISPGVACVLEGEGSWITGLTSMFLHGGWFHIISNMWFLAVFGDNVEDSMGHVRFLVFYVLCGFAALAAQMASNPDSALPMVGASGAIGGVMGAYAVLYPQTRVHVLIVLGFWIDRIVLPAYFMLFYWFFLQVIGGIPTLQSEGGGVAFWAHVGGFVAGAVLIFVFRDPRRVAAHRALLLRHAD